MNSNYLPVEWEDEERIRVLMGPMPHTKDTIAVNGRITFWGSALHNWARLKGGLTFTLTECQLAFRRSTQIPVCLPQVIQQLINRGDLITYESLAKSSSGADTWLSWGQRMITLPPRWLWNIVQNSLGKGSLEKEIFLDRNVLEQQCDQMLSSFWEFPRDSKNLYTGDLISVEELYRRLQPTSDMTLEDLRIMLLYLLKKNKVIMKEHRGTTLVKLMKPGQTDALSITELEIAEYDLVHTQKILEERLQSMQEEADRLRDDAKQSLRVGSRYEEKEKCEKSAQKILSALENVSSCLHQLQESVLNINVLHSFEAGMNALKMSIATAGGVEGATNTLSTLQDLLDECNDISDTVAFGITSPVTVDDTELELELKKLEMDSESSYSSAQGTYAPAESKLPDVPKRMPFMSAVMNEVTDMDTS